MYRGTPLGWVNVHQKVNKTILLVKVTKQITVFYFPFFETLVSLTIRIFLFDCIVLLLYYIDDHRV